MKWTTEQPAEVGWYWVFLHDGRKFIVEIVEKSGVLRLYDDVLCSYMTLSYVQKFAGPIPEPEAKGEES